MLNISLAKKSADTIKTFTVFLDKGTKKVPLTSGLQDLEDFSAQHSALSGMNPLWPSMSSGTLRMSQSYWEGGCSLAGDQFPCLMKTA